MCGSPLALTFRHSGLEPESIRRASARRREPFSAQGLGLAGYRLKAGMREAGFHVTKSMARCAGLFQTRTVCGIAHRQTASKLPLPADIRYANDLQLHYSISI
ncbi:MAG: hypothetical protein U5L46_05245 [Agrobacterium sp.]|nr:hypothetical protein [Agrobacterium sp.]